MAGSSPKAASQGTYWRAFPFRVGGSGRLCKGLSHEKDKFHVVPIKKVFSVCALLVFRIFSIFDAIENKET
jgi:hypothetical protein